MTDDNIDGQSQHEPHMAEVGRIAAAWAAIEFQMDHLIWALSEVEQMLGACITSQLTTTTARFRMIVALLRFREAPEDFIKTINSIEGRSHPIREERNRAVHSPWGTGRISAFQMRVSLDNKALSFGTREVPISELKETYRKISNLNDEFGRLCNQIYPWLLSSPQKWRDKLVRIERIPKDAQHPHSAPKAP